MNMKITIEDVSTNDLAAFLAHKGASPAIGLGTNYPASTEQMTFNKVMLLRKLSGIMAYVASGQKINAIKEVRELFGCGLKEAKDVVEGNFY
jgi:ribosomal protein L7/L12